MSIAGCNNIRTLQNDLSLLRDEFMVDISFSRKRGRYEMRNAGTFLIDIGASQIELDALAVGLRLSGAIPYFKEASNSIWAKISIFIPTPLLLRSNLIYRNLNVENHDPTQLSGESLRSVLDELCCDDPQHRSKKLWARIYLDEEVKRR
ncbi:hypothetical protein LJC31_04460 [Synergistaceae bacterium OttesenSCG-928-I11]|nr:hypothetical protein [Synergistaceae bacterium OttesenSCG-928-I11]